MQRFIFWSFEIRLLYFVFIFLISYHASAVKTTGRFTLGVSTSTERFVTNDFGSNKNDTLYSSQRIFYKVTEIGDDKWELVSDFRNKYDSFDKLNKEQYQLDPKDEFQVRQFSLRMLNPKGSFTPIFGRFQVPEAGSVFNDGANLQFRLWPEWYSGLFAGLNPKKIDKSYLESDPKAQIAGAFLTYQTSNEGWDKNQYLSHGFVQQKYDNQMERQFLFHNGIYQWEEDSRFISMAYFDFVPTSYIQTLSVIYQQRYNKRLSSEIGTLGIDVIEYQRRQNVLEKLKSSPYKENHISIDYRLDKDATLTLYASDGQRDYDKLKRSDIYLGYRLQNFISKNWDTQIRVTQRKNFTSQDTLVTWGIGYFSKNYEVVLDTDYATQKNDDGTVTHPLNTELSLTSFISKELFASLSLQRAADENVTILGSFLKIGYRFGNQELPPIRDGAAPRGSL